MSRSDSNLPRSSNGSIVCCIEGTCHLPDARWHGTSGGYSNHGCRCPDCTGAWSQFHYERSYATRYLRRLHDEGLTSRGTPRRYAYAPRSSVPGRRPNRHILPPS